MLQATNVMQALVYEGPRIMNMRELPIPEPAPGEALVRVARAGICGSELSGFLGHNSLRVPPLVMGHEFSGTISALGADVSRFAAGDRVTANPLVSCGKCTDCKAGSANLCADRKLIGAGRPGAFAEYVAVPEENLYKLPDSVSFDDGALAEPLACAVRGCRLARLESSARLLIVGAGPIGLFVLQAARIFGVQQVVVMDVNLERLQIVEDLGGIPAASTVDLQKLSPARGFDAAVDAVGMDVTRQRCMQFVKPGGTVIFSGLHASDSTLPVNLAIRNELRLYGTFGYNPTDFDLALAWLTDGKIRMSPWILHAPLADGQSCFETLINGPGKTAKIMLTI